MKRSHLLAGALLAAATLARPGAARAQIQGISPAPQLWRWWRARSENLHVFYSSRRFGRQRGAEREELERLARALLRTGESVRAEMAERLDLPPADSAIRLTGMVPGDYRQRRYLPGRGGVALWFTPETFGLELEPVSRDAWLERELRDQLAQAVLWDQITRHEGRNPVRRYLFRRLMPRWFLLGLGAHLAGRVTTLEEQILLASVDGRPPIPLRRYQFLQTFPAIEKEFAYQQARDFCRWLLEERGVEAVTRFLPALRQRPTELGEVFEHAFGLPLHQARQAWLGSLRARREAADAAAPPPPRVRALTDVPGWMGPFTPSPDGRLLALGLARRDLRSRLLDLSVIPRFGEEKEAGYLGGDPVIGAPQWISPDKIVTLEQAQTPFGQRLQRLVLHRVARRTDDEGLLGDLTDAVTVGGRFLEKIMSARRRPLYEARNLRELEKAPGGRTLSLLALPAGRPELILLDLPPPEEVLYTSRLRERARHPLPVDVVTHRWLSNRDELLLVTRAGAGARLLGMHPDTGATRELLDWPRPVRAAFGSAERVFFVEEAELPGVHRLLELRTRTGEVREVLRSARGILSPRPVEDGSWVTYGVVTPSGFALRELPLPPPRPEPPTVDPADLELPEVVPELAYEEGDVVLQHGRYRPILQKPSQNFVVDEDAIGTTIEWRDAFNNASLQVAAWRGTGIQKANAEVLYYSNRARPSWFVGAYDSDDEDLLGIFPFSNFSSATSQRGGVLGWNLQATPHQSLALTMESKEIEFDPVVFAGRVPGSAPRFNALKLHWTLNELSSSLDSTGASPVGDRLLNLTLGRSGFGGDAKFWELLGDWRTYFPLRRASDSLAMRLAFGLREPDLKPSAVPLDFALGGPESFRGLRDAALIGENFVQTSLEYRRLLSDRSWLKRMLEAVRIGDLFRAFDTSRVYASLFFDMGTAYSDGFEWGRVERSVGVELRTQGLLTTFRPVSFRLGFAHGFGPLGENDVYLVTSTAF